MAWRILLIDDDEDDFILTRELLTDFQQEEVTLEWINNDGDGELALRRQEHDLYLIDYRLGAGDGLALLRTAIAEGNRRPMILMTGQGDREVDVKAMRAGAADYLVKGTIDAALLERSIRYAIQRTEAEAELAEMQQRLTDSREEERIYLAQELHDGPLQDLIGAGFHLRAAAHCDSQAELETELSLIQERLTAVISTLRALCTDLRPPVLAPFGLEQAIRAHVAHFQSLHPNIAVDLNLDADGQCLTNRMRLALFRIVQHALRNIVEHADATQVRIIFQLRDDTVCLRILDDGRGFVVPVRWIEFARQGHLGLLGASERAAVIGGNLEVQSSPDAGTTLTVIAPYEPQAKDNAS